MIQMNLFTKQKQNTDLEIKLMVTKGEMSGEGQVAQLQFGCGLE